MNLATLIISSLAILTGGLWYSYAFKDYVTGFITVFLIVVMIVVYQHRQDEKKEVQKDGDRNSTRIWNKE